MELKIKSITRHHYNGLRWQHQVLKKIWSNWPSHGTDGKLQTSLNHLGNCLAQLLVHGEQKLLSQIRCWVIKAIHKKVQTFIINNPCSHYFWGEGYGLGRGMKKPLEKSSFLIWVAITLVKSHQVACMLEISALLYVSYTSIRKKKNPCLSNIHPNLGSYPVQSCYSGPVCQAQH